MARDGERELIKRTLQKPQVTIKSSATQSDVKSKTVEPGTSKNPGPETGQSEMFESCTQKLADCHSGQYQNQFLVLILLTVYLE